MLSRLKVEHYKSLFDVEVKLEPLTVFIGPNGSGKSNICEALAIVSAVVKTIFADKIHPHNKMLQAGFSALDKNIVSDQMSSFFWHGRSDYLKFEVEHSSPNISEITGEAILKSLSIYYDNDSQILELSNSNSHEKPKDKYRGEAKRFLVAQNYSNSGLASDLKLVRVYDFSPTALNSSQSSSGVMSRVGRGFLML
jgi:AAA15 family ATPase/GTPase